MSFTIDKDKMMGYDKIKVEKKKGLFHCQICHENFEGSFELNIKSFIVICSNCNSKNLAISDDKKAWTMIDDRVKLSETD